MPEHLAHVCPLTRYHIVPDGGHKALCPPAQAQCNHTRLHEACLYKASSSLCQPSQHCCCRHCRGHNSLSTRRNTHTRFGILSMEFSLSDVDERPPCYRHVVFVTTLINASMQTDSQQRRPSATSARYASDGGSSQAQRAPTASGCGYRHATRWFADAPVRPSLGRMAESGRTAASKLRSSNDGPAAAH
jgi:hypothetical protein